MTKGTGGPPGSERIVRVGGVDHSVDTLGDPAHPAILLAGHSLWWEDEFCERLAAGSRFVVRYDRRDTGRSVSYPPGAPPYTLRDLAADAAGLLDALGVAAAHFVGFSVGGWIGQLLAIDHPDRVASLTLISTRPTAPGRNDPDLPEHSREIMAYLTEAGEPDWSDRAAVVDHVVRYERALAGSRPFGEAAVRRLVEHTVDRTADMASSLSNLAFLPRRDRWRERLGEIVAPTLVVHGTEDPFFPIGNAHALVNEIPGARLLPLEHTGHELPRAVWDVVVPAVLEHTSGG